MSFIERSRRESTPALARLLGDAAMSRAALGACGFPVAILDAMHHVPRLVVYTPTIMMAIGFAIAYLFYIRRPDIPVEMAKNHQLLYRFLLNKWYFDELYDAVFVQPALAIGRLFWKKGDGAMIDGLGPDGIAARSQDLAGVLSRFQSGYLYHYAFVMLVGVAALVTYFMYPVLMGR